MVTYIFKAKYSQNRLYLNRIPDSFPRSAYSTCRPPTPRVNPEREGPRCGQQRGRTIGLGLKLGVRVGGADRGRGRGRGVGLGQG